MFLMVCGDRFFSFFIISKYSEIKALLVFFDWHYIYIIIRYYFYIYLKKISNYNIYIK
jgi:hypothetical protein